MPAQHPAFAVTKAPTRQRRTAALPVAGLLLGALLVPPALADEAQETRERIEQLEARIADVRRAQQARNRERGALQKELENRERELADLARKKRGVESERATTQARIGDLRQQQQSLNASAQAQQQAVKDELLAAYRSGGNDQLRLLLGDDDPQTLARRLTYYRYILKARSEVLDRYEATLEELNEVAAELEQQRAQLLAQEQRLTAQQAKLEETRAERRDVLARIESDLAQGEREIATQLAEQQELETLLEEIEAALAQLIPEENVQAFSEARGSMAWPVEGRITERFGRPRNSGKMKWQGVRLKAETGATVSAIHHGRVVYADWLRGSGLLLVIDHGEGYMSLYAHNESLLRDVGEWVSTGAAIATVGDSGGQSEAGLYFEIRKDGKPTNPQAWCSG